MGNQFITDLQSFLDSQLLPQLSKGRSTDIEHTKLVVFYLKQIIDHTPEIEFDIPVLLISAYAHDWGYADLFNNQKPLDLAEIGAQKKQHMLVGASLIENFLQNPFFSFLNNDQKTRIAHLVSVHDDLQILKDQDELVLMEADTLGGLDPEVMGVFNDPESEARFMRKNRQLRFSKFITFYSKTEYEKLFAKRLEYFQSKN